jgi:hypothetical protein
MRRLIGEAQRRGVMGGGIYIRCTPVLPRARAPGRIVTRNPSHFAHAAPDLEILTP